uniref:Ubiquitin-like protease family profile domain-containing protein n=1 Tax=Knipowitschia caucasica TaxID=637954 RepID=A0AAV2KXL1_KNICA
MFGSLHQRVEVSRLLKSRGSGHMLRPSLWNEPLIITLPSKMAGSCRSSVNSEFAVRLVTPLQTIKVSAVWELLGPFPKTTDGYQYIFTATDYFSNSIRNLFPSSLLLWAQASMKFPEEAHWICPIKTGGHWVLVVVLMEDKSVLLIDPMGNEALYKTNILKNWRKFLRQANRGSELNDSKGSGKGLIQNHSESFTARTARTSRRGQAGRRTLR